ncbi:hypothetical protein SAMN05720489_2701 [Fibrobacter sp. UWB13]|nr:hypothetical protein SAMN05720467_2521 [Fibrobacter sp. UWB7]SMG38946.1 hypothetical protein SAMN05720489_2701 [Fibrobacter sp. UWB13]
MKDFINWDKKTIIFKQYININFAKLDKIH